MKKPKTPPALSELLVSFKPNRLFNIMALATTQPLSKEYLHWDKLVHLKPPMDFTTEEWWATIKLWRTGNYKDIPLRDKNGQPFKYMITDPIPESLHKIDLSAGGRIGIPNEIINRETRDQYYISSLIEEAITSSQIEGATTTREVAKEMIRSARQPKDRSEQMILNNYQTMQKIGEIKNEQLTIELIMELHRMVTENALDNPDAAGRFRKVDEDVVVEDLYGEIYHIPPLASELDERMQKMCDFANGHTPEYFIHPAIRAIILHFWLSYDHPFVDGNGRTARALFYWCMLHYGFWLCEYISISHIIRKAQVKYAKAFLYTETDDNDLTYFIIYHIDILHQAIDALDAYIKIKSEQLSRVERQIRNIALLNHRQRALINHALRHPHFWYTTEGHQLSHNISYQTARNDLTDLVTKGLLRSTKSGKTYFTPVDSLEKKLNEIM